MAPCGAPSVSGTVLLQPDIAAIRDGSKTGRLPVDRPRRR